MNKILCLIDSLGPGGAQRQLVGLASLLKEKGYDVTVAIYYNDLFYVDVLRSKGVPCIYLKEASGTKRRILKIAKYIKSERPEVVISFLETPCICASIAKLLCGKFKLIVSERNTTQKTGWTERIRFNLFRLADFVVPNAYAQAEYIEKTFPFLTKKMVTIPNYVDLDKFTPPENRLRRDIVEILIAASIWESKNTVGFIDAVAVLKNKGYRFHVTWLGKDARNIKYYNECQKKIEKNNLSQYIELKEKTNNIAACYKSADFFCLPSFYEGTPNVICEAMASGLPVICSDVCDNPRYVSKGFNGFLFNPKELDSIVVSLEKALRLSDKDYSLYCSRSRDIAEKQLSRERFINDYLKLIG